METVLEKLIFRIRRSNTEMAHICGMSVQKDRLRIVFMGTPDFAVASLAALVESGYDIVGVITAPDKPAGRGLQLQQSAVKKYALEHGLTVLQPPKLKNGDFLKELKDLRADVQVVVAFRMLPEVVWAMPPMGTINVHGSLLPQYRGAAPINWAVINGEKETGVTTFKLQQEIDTGDILLQEPLPIGENETAGELHDRMKEAGARLLVKTVEGLQDGSLKEKPQSSVTGASIAIDLVGRAFTIKHAPKIFTETGVINWHKPVAEIHNLVRGLSPFPGALTHLNGKLLKIFRSEKETGASDTLPGDVKSDNKTYLKFACTDGFLIIKELQLEGKKRMTTEEFLRGNKV